MNSLAHHRKYLVPPPLFSSPVEGIFRHGRRSTASPSTPALRLHLRLVLPDPVRTLAHCVASWSLFQASPLTGGARDCRPRVCAPPGRRLLEVRRLRSIVRRWSSTYRSVYVCVQQLQRDERQGSHCSVGLVGELTVVRLELVRFRVRPFIRASRSLCRSRGCVDAAIVKGSSPAWHRRLPSLSPGAGSQLRGKLGHCFTQLILDCTYSNTTDFQVQSSSRKLNMQEILSKAGIYTATSFCKIGIEEYPHSSP
ncbi:uncharacterized protein LOC119333504 [Triticum dicoccoides]|uniref:uncharacterized protein LOC119333504 n=1 Tax=Triticum dicoccoides TaxID=85692 RepID=UPI001890EF87|nr:uncharacterized protein LOC119333504 [Triticum dicoccoides]